MTQESDPEHTVRCVQLGDLRLLLGSFGGEGAQCITRSGGGGQEQEARSEEHSGWSLAASVFIVSLDTTLKPEDGSMNRAFNPLDPNFSLTFSKKTEYIFLSYVSIEELFRK